MGSWWHVEIEGQSIPVFGKNFVSDELMLVFADSDRFTRNEANGHEGQVLDGHQDDDSRSTARDPSRRDASLLGYSAAAATLRDRLELQGFSSAHVLASAGAFLDDELARSTEFGGSDWRDAWREERTAYPDGAAVSRALAARKGLAAATALELNRTDHEQRFLQYEWEAVRENFEDPRFALALALTEAPDTADVTLDLTALVGGGWLDADDVPHRDARTRLAASVAASGPVIVITEGESDARWLRRSLELATPATAHLFEFLDFAEYRPPGGADRVVSLTKGMAAAQVMNRIIAVLDNDATGRAAADQLNQLRLPERIAVITLPDVPYALAYPTLGPDGCTTTNVNGRAVSIEFMFGENVLRDSDGTLFPVRLHSFIDTSQQYQGRMRTAHKTVAGQRIDRALAGTTAVQTSGEVLEGCRLLASMLVAAAAPRHAPTPEPSDSPGTDRTRHSG